MARDPFGFPLEIEHDLDGWQTTLRGGTFQPIEALIGIVHFGLGSVFAVGGLYGLLLGLLDFLPLSLFPLPFALVGMVFAGWPVLKFARMLSVVHVEVSGRSVRIEHSFGGWVVRRVEVPLEHCADAEVAGPFWNQRLHIGGARFPIFVEGGGKGLVDLLHEGAELGASDSVSVPPLPEALASMRGRDGERPA